MQTLSDPQDQLRSLLRELGFSPCHMGYRLLTDALVLYRQDPGQSLTKSLYPALARQTRIYSATNIERSIRYAITEAWARGPRETWERFFPHLTKAPSNALFLATMAEYRL